MKTSATGLLVLLSVFVAESAIAQQGINAPPDAIFYNGKIITVDSGFTIAQAFAVRGDVYVAVGSNDGNPRARRREYAFGGSSRAPRSSPACRITTTISTTAKR